MLRSLSLPLLLLVGFLVGCDSVSGPREAGRLSLLLTDAPGDIATAVVTIDAIYLQGGEDDGGDSGRVYLRETPVTANLLDLQNEVLTLVNGVLVPGGRYSQLRLVISGGYIEVVEEEDELGAPTITRIYASSEEYAASQGVEADGHLQMPSFGTSGLKVNLPGGSVEIDGDDQIILLDFDVSESFGHAAGESGQWVMHPVIRATDFTTGVEAEFSLSAADSVTLPEVNGQPVTLGDFAVAMEVGTDTITKAFIEDNGTFTASFFVQANTDYKVWFVEPEGVDVTLNNPFPTTINVASGILSLPFEITSASVE